MDSNKALSFALGYTVLGLVWLGLIDYVLPKPATGQLSWNPPGGAAGQVVLWPVSAVSYAVSLAQQGTQSTPTAT